MKSFANFSPLILILFASFIVSLSSATTAEGQSWQLLKHAEVLEILSVAEEHRQTLQEIAEKAKKAEKRLEMMLTGGKDFDSLPSAKQEEVRKRFIVEIVAIDDEIAKQMKVVLSPEQFQRLGNMRIQLLGPAGFVSGSLDRDLGITEAKKAELIKIGNGFQKEFAEKYKSEIENLSRPETFQFYQARLIDTFLAELGKETEEKYRSLAGEPFEVLPAINELR